MSDESFETKILKVNPNEPDPAAIAEAAGLLRAGQVIAFPTETVYGLAADGLNEEAIAKVFVAKERPVEKPLVLFVSDPEDAGRLVEDLTCEARELIRAFWPGPLTVLLRRSSAVPAAVTAGAETVGIRCPDNAVARALVRAAGRPLATTSANISGAEAPTDASGVMKQMGGRIPLILDGGPTRIGVPSTVVDLTVRPAKLLREGPITKELLSRYIAV